MNMEEVYVIGSATPSPPLAENCVSVPELVRCTACNKELKTSKRKCFKHPRLDVLLCKSCLKFISTNEFTKDEDGIEEYCTWCGDGGNLVCCDFCEKAYCKHCVKRNLGKEFLKALLDAPDDSKWKCFVCDHGQIRSFVEECEIVIKYIKAAPPEEKMKNDNNKNSSASAIDTKDHSGRKEDKVSNGISAKQLERMKRLQEVTKQVENVNTTERVGFKSSFVRLEISDDDDTPDTPDTPAIAKTDSGSNIVNMLGGIRNIGGLDSSDPTANANADGVHPPCIDLYDANDSEKLLNGADSHSKNILSGNPEAATAANSKCKSLSSVLERLQGDSREAFSDNAVNDTAKNSSLETKESKDGQMKGKKKQIVLNVSSSSDGSDEEIVLMSKSGKQKILSKSLLKLAHAAIDIQETKISKKDDQSINKKKSMVKAKKKKKRDSSDDSSSEVEKSTSDSNSSDDEPLISKVKSNKQRKTKSSPVFDKPKVNGTDEQQPGPSGVRPKNRLQRNKVAQPKQADSDTSDEDPLITPKCGILSKKFRPKDETSTTKEVKLADSNGVSNGKYIKGIPSSGLQNKVENISEKRSAEKKELTMAAPIVDVQKNRNEDESYIIRQVVDCICNIVVEANDIDKVPNRYYETDTQNASLLQELHSEVTNSGFRNKDEVDSIQIEPNKVTLPDQESFTENSIHHVPHEDIDGKSKDVTTSGSIGSERGNHIANETVIESKKKKNEGNSGDMEGRNGLGHDRDGDHIDFETESGETSNKIVSAAFEGKTKADDSDSDDEVLLKKKKKEETAKSNTQDDSDDEVLCNKNQGKRAADAINESESVGTDSEADDDGPRSARRASKRKKNQPCDKSSTTNKSKEQKSVENDGDDESDFEDIVQRFKRKRRKVSEKSDESDSEPLTRNKRKRRTKKRKKKTDTNETFSSKLECMSSSSSEGDNIVDEDDDEDDDDDDDDVVLNNHESDSSSTDGSIVITRKNKHKNEAEISKKNKTEDLKGKGKKGGKKIAIASDSSNDDKAATPSKGDKRKGKKNSESESDDEATPSKGGRKKIRNIIKDKDLDEDTVKAQQAEKERRKRLKERAKKEREEMNIAENVVDGDFILERNDKKETVVSVSSEINKHLKPHQRKGVQFMYDCLIETVESYKKGDPGGGCLLAHCMGLGKTLQVVTLVHTLMNTTDIKMERFLVCCPLNTVLNWENEFNKWIPDEPEEEKPYIYVLSYCNGLKERMTMLRDWHKQGGVLISGYEMYRNLVTCKQMKSKKMKADVKEFLSDPGPDMVVCDEGHVLKNDATALSKAMSALKTQRRVVLTGTPLQNNLLEYHCMVDFVKPKLLGTRVEYKNRFVNPILNGQCSNSTAGDVRIMKQRCHVLFQLLAGCVQRQDYSVLTPYLPNKREYTIFVRLHEKQINMYRHYLEEFVYRDGNTQKVRSSLFSDFQCLSRVWSHPWCLQIDRVKQAHRNRYKSDDDFVTDEEEDEKTTSESEDNDKKKPWDADTSSDEENDKSRRRRRDADISDSSDSDDSEKEKKEVPLTSSRSSRSTRSTMAVAKDVKKKKDVENVVNDCDNVNHNSDEQLDDFIAKSARGNLRSGINFKDGSQNPARTEEEEEYETAWFDKFLEKEDEHMVELGGKLVMLLEILANAEAVGDKILVFSQSLTTLDLIERALTHGTFEGDKLCWMHGVNYFRMDGSTPVKTRKRWSDIFNDPDNEECRLFLISTRAGSLGINMVGANRVIVFDCSWNPSHDVQSVFRVYRFGQEKPVYVYRFIAQGTMEEKIYGRQITKLATSGRVVDEQQIGRHFTDEEIRELYTFSPDKLDDNVETPQLPKDPLLAEVLQRLHPKYIVRYHEHDLLLENVQEEELNEEERKLAWKNYEDEKAGAAKTLDFRNLVPPGASSLSGAPTQSFIIDPNYMLSDPYGLTAGMGAPRGAIQPQRYTIAYPPHYTAEQRQRALLELRQREVMRLLIQQRNQQNRGSTVMTNNYSHDNVTRLQNIAPRPPLTNYPMYSGAGVSESNSSGSISIPGNPSNNLNIATSQKHTESRQGGAGSRLVSAQKARPSYYDIT